jgi:mRNA interferase MazF
VAPGTPRGRRPPRRCGGASADGELDWEPLTSSPPTPRCSARHIREHYKPGVLPADAGVLRSTRTTPTPPTAPPRRRGGAPSRPTWSPAHRRSSPLTRGCSARREGRPPAADVLPADAGVLRRRPRRPASSSSPPADAGCSPAGGGRVPPDGRNVLIISLTGLEEAYGAVLVIVLHDSGRYPDTAMSVVIGDPLPCTAVAVNTVQLRLDRFDGAKLLGPSMPRHGLRGRLPARRSGPVGATSTGRPHFLRAHA